MTGFIAWGAIIYYGNQVNTRRFLSSHHFKQSCGLFIIFISLFCGFKITPHTHFLGSKAYYVADEICCGGGCAPSQMGCFRGRAWSSEIHIAIDGRLADILYRYVCCTCATWSIGCVVGLRWLLPVSLLYCIVVCCGWPPSVGLLNLTLKPSKSKSAKRTRESWAEI